MPLFSCSAETRSRLLLVTAALLWSTSGLMLKSPPLAALTQAHPVQSGPLLACFRAIFASFLLLPFVRHRSIRWRPMLIPLVLSFASMNVLYVTAVTRTTAAAAIFLQYTSAVWATVFAILILKERANRGNLIALGFVVCGIAWIVVGDWTSKNFLGNLIALGSGFSYAGVILCLRALRDEDSVWLVALCHLVSGLILLPWVRPLDISLEAQQWLLVMALGVVQMALPYVLFARALRQINAQDAALIPLVELILNPIWVWLFWNEPVASATWVGGGFILFGLAIRYLAYRSHDASRVQRR